MGYIIDNSGSGHLTTAYGRDIIQDNKVCRRLTVTFYSLFPNIYFNFECVEINRLYKIYNSDKTQQMTIIENDGKYLVCMADATDDSDVRAFHFLMEPYPALAK